MNILYVLTASVFGASLLPLALLAAFRYVGEARRTKLRSLLESSPRLASTFAGEFAAYKYELLDNPGVQSSRTRFWQWPGVASVGVFILLTSGCFALSAIVASNPETLTNLNILLMGFDNGPDQPDYQRAAKFYTIAFAVAYLWSIYFLLRQVVDFALTPVHFLQASLQIVTAIFLAYIIWPLTSKFLVGEGAALALTVVAIVVGLHRELDRRVFERIGRAFERISAPGFRLFFRSRRDRSSELPEPIPLSMFDGLDFFIGKLLVANGIEDAEALAMANPVLLFVETPIGLHRAVDLVAQAQLACAVTADKFRDLRRFGIRNVFDMEFLAGEKGSTSDIATRILADIILPHRRSFDGESAPFLLSGFTERLKASLQVQRLFEIQANLSYVPRMPDEASGAATLSDDLEQRMMNTITKALSAPRLLRYYGWVSTKIINDDASGMISLAVRFFQSRPDWGKSDEISISDGDESVWVDFDLELRVGLDRTNVVTERVSVPSPGNSKDYVLTARYDFAARPEVWLQIFQRNRLVQVIRADAASSDSKPADGGDDDATAPAP